MSEASNENYSQTNEQVENQVPEANTELIVDSTSGFITTETDVPIVHENEQVITSTVESIPEVQCNPSEEFPMTVGNPEPETPTEISIDVTSNDGSTVEYQETYIPTITEPVIQPEIATESYLPFVSLEYKIKDYEFNIETNTVKLIFENDSYVQLSKEVIKTLNAKLSPELIMPQTELERTQRLYEQIFKIRMSRNLTIQSIDEAIENLRLERAEVRKKIKDADNPKDAAKWSKVLASFASDKTLIDSRRHLVRMSYMEEGKLKTELLELQKQNVAKKPKEG
jgi:hypothetical protein